MDKEQVDDLIGQYGSLEAIALCLENLGPSRALDAISERYTLHLRRGEPQIALSILRQGTEAMKCAYGAKDRSTVTCLANLAVTLAEVGELRSAFDLRVEVLEMIREIFGEQHSYTIVCSVDLRALDCLAGVASRRQHQGRRGETEGRAKHLLETGKGALYEEDPDVSAHLFALALQLDQKKRYVGAVTLLVQTLEQRRKILGATHYDTIASTAILAATYARQSHWEQVEEVATSALSTMERELGLGHVFTLSTLGNLALAVKNQGRLKEAGELQALVVDMRERVFGRTHPKTIASSDTLAAIYFQLGRFDEASRLALEVFQARHVALGAENPCTITSKAHLARIYNAQGRYDDARLCGESLIEPMRRILGDAHRETLATFRTLASTYENQSQYHLAEQLHEQLARFAINKYGMNRPETLAAMADLAMAYHLSGKQEEMMRLARHLIDDTARGDTYPDTLTSIANLSVVLFEAQWFDQAEELGKRVLDLRIQLLGGHNLATIVSMSNLAMVYNEQGKKEEGANLLMDVIRKNFELRGPEHPTSLIYIYHLALIRFQQGHKQVAEHGLRSIASKLEVVLGPENKYTVSCKQYLSLTEAEQCD